jgi:hypothetical protein
MPDTPGTSGNLSRRTLVQGQSRQNVRPCIKKYAEEKGLEVWLKWPSKYEALSSNPSTSKKESSKI